MTGKESILTMEERGMLMVKKIQRSRKGLTVNSPVTASNPTWIVCSKSDGREISGRSFSFFLLARSKVLTGTYFLRGRSFSHFTDGFTQTTGQESRSEPHTKRVPCTGVNWV